MNLKELAEFIEQQRESFVSVVRVQSHKLRIEDIVKDIDESPLIFPSQEDEKNFVDGEDIMLKLKEGYFKVRISIDYLSVETPNGYVLKDFGGEVVTKLYRSLTTRILEERDLPF